MWAAATGSSAGLSAPTRHLSTPQRNLLEAHWNGTLLDAPEAVCDFTAFMTWKGVHPVVALVTTTYATGVTLTKDIMAVVEAQLARLPTWTSGASIFPTLPEAPGMRHCVRVPHTRLIDYPDC